MKLHLGRDPFYPWVERWSPSRRRYVLIKAWGVFDGERCLAWQMSRADSARWLRNYKNRES